MAIFGDLAHGLYVLHLSHDEKTYWFFDAQHNCQEIDEATLKISVSTEIFEQLLVKCKLQNVAFGKVSGIFENWENNSLKSNLC